jgi:hypothetical protein
MTIYQSTKVLPYVYMGIHRETGQFYIGSRTSKRIKLPPEQDILKYRTSSKIVKPIFDQFDWFIIAMFFDKDFATDFEQELIKENWENPLIMNQHYQYGGGNMYAHNLVRTGANNSFYGKTHSEESKRKMSESRMGKLNPNFGKSHSDETKQKMRESKKGKLEKLWKIINPNGEEFIIFGLRQFCRKTGLDQGNMINVSRGKSKHHKGWKCVRLD